MNFQFDKLDLTKNVHSQFGEEVIISHILEVIESNLPILNPTFVKYCVEFGAGDGYNMSNTRKLLEQGWEGLMIDGDNKGNSEVLQKFITRDNIIEIFAQNNVPYYLGMLSVDMDGNDIYILEKILEEYKPALIVSEVNSAMNPHHSLTIPYDENHVFTHDSFYGYSYAAGQKLAEKFGYTIIYNHLNLNLFYLRNDLLFGYKPMVRFKQTHNWPPRKNAQPFINY